MLKDNIKNLRKQKGYSQETLAQELNVVRQTVSKWEKGYSVPDAVMLEQLAELFEVSIAELLGENEAQADNKTDITQIAAQLSILNDQFAKELTRKKKIRKTIKTILIVLLVACIVFAIFAMISMRLYSFNIEQADPNSSVDSSFCEVNDKLDDAVSKAIMKSTSSYDGEFAAEAHLIYGTEEDGEFTKVYLQERVSSFQFQNGFFVERGGHIIPAVYTFKITENSTEFVKSEYPQDGSLYKSSIKKLFPSMYEKKVLGGMSDAETSFLWIQISKQAKNYLTKIGRDAEVCDYGDIEHLLLCDIGVSVEVDNKMLDLMPDYDYEVGNHEKIENGKRYVYQTEYLKNKSLITYTKFEYDTGNIVEFTAVNSLNGKVANNVKPPKTAKYIKGKLTQKEYTAFIENE